MANRDRLVDKLKSLPTSQGKNKPFDNLTPEQKQEWESVKRAITSGELSHLSRNEIRRQVAADFDIPKLTESTFRKILLREGVIKPRDKE